jgi:hypothetical protein
MRRLHKLAQCDVKPEAQLVPRLLLRHVLDGISHLAADGLGAHLASHLDGGQQGLTRAGL